MPYFLISPLAKALLPSMAAAAALGPKQGIPRSSSRSTAPITSGSSGATTAKSTPRSTANPTMASRSSAPMGTHSAQRPMPPFPGSA